MGFGALHLPFYINHLATNILVPCTPCTDLNPCNPNPRNPFQSV
jgi:hypothetical protein